MTDQRGYEQQGRRESTIFLASPLHPRSLSLMCHPCAKTASSPVQFIGFHTYCQHTECSITLQTHMNAFTHIYKPGSNMVETTSESSIMSMMQRWKSLLSLDWRQLQRQQRNKRQVCHHLQQNKLSTGVYVEIQRLFCRHRRYSKLYFVQRSFQI